jgi:DNA polymerase-1
MAKKLFLLDGMALVYRAHFALVRSPIFTSDGVNTSALFGFANTLIDIQKKQNPTHLAVVFDTQAPTTRHIEFPAYKAQREEMPEDLAKAIPNVKRLVKAFDIPVLEMDGYEADDIIGTLAQHAVEDDAECEVYMVTPDKDFAQLVAERIFIYKPGRQGSDIEILGVPEILAKWEIERPEQVIDILGMWGDASDNIPGIPGIGEKTAKKLIKQFGSMEVMLESTDQLKGKQKENVIAFREQALLSKKLATIIVDAPVPLNWDALKITAPHDEEVKNVLVEFELNALGKRLYGNDFKAGRGRKEEQANDGAVLKTIKDVPHDYKIVKTAGQRASLIEKLNQQKSFCFDLETTELDEKMAQVLGLAFSYKAGSGYYVVLPERKAEGVAVLKEFEPLLSKPEVEKIGHNLKFDLAVLGWNGVETCGPFFDTMLAHSLIEPDQRHKMDYLSEVYLGYTPISIKTLIGEAKKEESAQMTMLDLTMAEASRANLNEVAEYAAEDADVTLQLAEKLRPMLEERGQMEVYYEIEGPLLPVLVNMEQEGIAIHKPTLAEISVQLGETITALEKKIIDAAGEPFNVSSPKQLGEILFDKLKLVDKPKKTPTGQYQTSEQTLASLAPLHPIVADVLDHREASKLKSTYVDALPGYVFSRTGRVHSSFMQLVTATGRLASNNPNLQNIPIRTALGKEVRKAFVPRAEGFELMAADYSQIELRVMASLSGDAAMIEAFRAGVDIHTATAARVNHVALEDVTSEMRRTAKMVNFGIIYGISAFGLSQRLGTVSRTEAGEIIEEYFKSYPGVKKFMDETIASTREKGYVETICGRRRYFRDINSSNGSVRGKAEREAINTPIQGSAADMIKIAMVRVSEALIKHGLKTRMILQVHDELVFDMAKDENEIVVPLVKRLMSGAMPLNVPVLVETGTGENWLQAH